MFVDTKTLLPDHLRTELSHQNGLQKMAAKFDTARTQAEFDRAKAGTKVGGPSVLSLLYQTTSSS